MHSQNKSLQSTHLRSVKSSAFLLSKRRKSHQKRLICHVIPINPVVHTIPHSIVAKNRGYDHAMDLLGEYPDPMDCDSSLLSSSSLEVEEMEIVDGLEGVSLGNSRISRQ